VSLQPPKILISACLLGEPVRYDGKSNPIQHPILDVWQRADRLMTCCPEMLGGLGVPRLPAERRGNVVMNVHGDDVSQAFEQGANLAWKLCHQHHILMAILKEGSPSCGVTTINDGSFQRQKISGMGLTSQYLIAHGVRVFSENQLDAALSFDLNR